MLKKLANVALFGNYYLALCIVALAVETGCKNNFSIANPVFYIALFLSVVVYYTYAYIGEGTVAMASNARSFWYSRNHRLIRFTQFFYTILIVSSCLFLAWHYSTSLSIWRAVEWFLVLLFPLVALLYYGVIFPAQLRYKLRNVAWLKPFVIGFVCTGSIVVYPLLFHTLEEGTRLHLSYAIVHYFFTNWLFTSAIAIMFDIKDFASDHNIQLKTFVVSRGLRYTLFFILLPLAIFSYFSFFLFALARQFSPQQIAINTIPFFLLLLAATSLRHRKGILYYLIVIDGLLLVKAVFGIAAMTWFN